MPYKDPEKKRTRDRQYYLENKEQKSRQNKEYVSKHKTLVSKQRKDKYQENRKNPEWLLKYKAMQRASYERHKEKIRKQHKEYYERTKETFLVRNSKWAKNNRDKKYVVAAQRRAQEKNAPRIEPIDRAYIYSRDKGICHICHKHVKKSIMTIDHLNPISKGGNHTQDNVALAHKSCNSRRGPGRITAQLRLFG